MQRTEHFLFSHLGCLPTIAVRDAFVVSLSYFAHQPNGAVHKHKENSHAYEPIKNKL